MLKETSLVERNLIWKSLGLGGECTVVVFPREAGDNNENTGLAVCATVRCFRRETLFLPEPICTCSPSVNIMYINVDILEVTGRQSRRYKVEFIHNNVTNKTDFLTQLSIL
jgi:hypothetical protein